MDFVRFGWRDYDTFTSRWTAPDPLGDQGGDPDWYGYCLDDPVNSVDPMGLFASWIAKQMIRQGLKSGIKQTGKKAAEKKPNSRFLKGVDRFLNGKGLDEDPKSMDADHDGIPDYWDYDSTWDVDPEQLKIDREDYHRKRQGDKSNSTFFGR